MSDVKLRSSLAQTETLEEYLARGGKIQHPKVIYPLPSRSFKTWQLDKDRLPPHGSRLRYTKHKCRCGMCTEANREYSRNYYRNVNAVSENKIRGAYK